MDIADHAADLQQQEIDRALAARRGRDAHPHPLRLACVDCDAPLHDVRIAMRAERCVECQTKLEARASR